jgi:hypothetical protein
MVSSEQMGSRLGPVLMRTAADISARLGHR